MKRIDYARRLEMIEKSLKAKKRKATTQFGNDMVCLNSNALQRTDELEDFADWDEGKLSTNKAFRKIKEEKEYPIDPKYICRRYKDKHFPEL